MDVTFKAEEEERAGMDVLRGMHLWASDVDPLGPQSKAEEGN